ncbi:protein of unknown function [Candidatus Hydrogenisulfobacillus filiaventi]|uniref:Uncharacterized protein n=1 Tax=Candidatus Hydrogenisulfobacillus filiaventi TaxID=2707344 RepID=A0A6F8ZGC1_9FIRM|nr:protein of unknown function [Candidatus Hydrogenisulfobacillus filiaventi]
MTTRERADAGDPEAFLAMVLKDGAFYWNILARLPFRERRWLRERLNREGPHGPAPRPPGEQRACGTVTRIPARKA